MADLNTTLVVDIDATLVKDVDATLAQTYLPLPERMGNTRQLLALHALLHQIRW